MKATEREKAIIFAFAAGFVDSWQKAYILSREYTTTEAEQIKSLRPTVTRWKQREDIAKAYQDAKTALQIRDEQTAQKTRDEITQTQTEDKQPEKVKAQTEERKSA